MNRVATTESRRNGLAVIGLLEILIGGVEVLAVEGAGRAAGVAANLVIEAGFAEATRPTVLAGGKADL